MVMDIDKKIMRFWQKYQIIWIYNVNAGFVTFLKTKGQKDQGQVTYTCSSNPIKYDVTYSSKSFRITICKTF